MSIGTDNIGGGHGGGLIHGWAAALQGVDGQVEPLAGVEGFGCFEIVVEGYHYKINFTAYLFVEFVDVGHFGNTGWTPSSPHIHKDGFAFKIF